MNDERDSSIGRRVRRSARATTSRKFILCLFASASTISALLEGRAIAQQSEVAGQAPEVGSGVPIEQAEDSKPSKRTSSPPGETVAIDSLSKNSQFSASAGFAERISPSSQVLLGQGYSSVSGAMRNNALVVPYQTDSLGSYGPKEPPFANPVTSPELQISYNLEYIDSYEQLAKSLRLDVSASYQWMTGSASASLSLFEASQLRKRNAYVLVTMTITNGVEQIPRFLLTKPARSLMARDRRAFFATYGDRFVHRVGRGSELVALLEFSSEDSSHQNSLKADIKAQVGTFKGSVSFESSLQEMTQKTRVRVLYAQTGGSTGEALKEVGESTVKIFATDVKYKLYTGGVISLTVEELIERLRRFPAESRASPQTAKVIWADLLDYSAAENRWEQAEPMDLTLARWTLEDLAAVRLRLRQAAADLTDGLEDTVVNPPTDEQRALYERLLERIRDSETELGRLSYLLGLDPTREQAMRVRSLGLGKSVQSELLGMTGSVPDCNLSQYGTPAATVSCILGGPIGDPASLDTLTRIIRVESLLKSSVIAQCRVCYAVSYSGGSDPGQCGGTPSGCTEWTAVGESWTPWYNDDTDEGAGWCSMRWRVECRPLSAIPKP